MSRGIATTRAVDRIRALRNPIRHYDWGSHDAIAAWTGRPTPTAQPEAELWLGAHPSDPSHVVLDDEGLATERLDAWIARDPGRALGTRVARQFGDELPFLFKVLAPARALSVQTHPDAARARRGFAREDAAGIARSDPRRSYRDPHAKPELICSLDGFTALCDLRERAAAARGLRELGIPQLAAVADRIASEGTAAGLCALLELAPDARRQIADASVAATTGARERAFALVATLGEQHPGDIGVLAPLLLNEVVLAPGEALFLEAGHVHAYLEGFGLELMGNSDNTLRAGLTRRHVDVSEFLDALDPCERPPRPLVPTRGPDGHLRYAAPTAAFELRRIEVGAGGVLTQTPLDGPEIWICTSGRARVHEARGNGSLELAPGSAIWVPASAGRFDVEGAGVLHVAGVAHAQDP